MNDPDNFYLNSKIIEIAVIFKLAIPYISSKRWKNIYFPNSKGITKLILGSILF